MVIMNKGKMIVIAGTDGSGKGTQTKLLHERLLHESYDVMITDFPRYGEPSCFMVERYLNGDFGNLDAKAASILYAVDRFAASKEMYDYLNRGGIILSNRYVSGNKGHQLGKIRDTKEREEFLDWLEDLEYSIFKIPKEDKNILLYVPPDIAQKLVDKKEARTYTDKKRDLHEADLNHLVNAAEAYMFVAKREGWDVIDCTRNGVMKSPKEINDELYAIVKKLI